MTGSKRIFDIVIEGGTTLTMAEGKDPLPNGRVCISGDRIELSMSLTVKMARYLRQMWSYMQRTLLSCPAL